MHFKNISVMARVTFLVCIVIYTVPLLRGNMIGIEEQIFYFVANFGHIFLLGMLHCTC